MVIARRDSRLSIRDSRLSIRDSSLSIRDSRLSRRDSRLERNEARGGNLLLSGTVHVYQHLPGVTKVRSDLKLLILKTNQLFVRTLSIH